MKHWETTLAILVALSTSLALAEDFKTTDGKEYENAKVNRVESDGIVITHSSGVAKIPFTELPKDVQQRLGYDAAKIEAERGGARAAEEKRIEDQKAVRERAQKGQSATANLAKSVEEFEAAEKRATESYKSSPRGTLSGQVFVATKGGENFKLGAMQVSLFARDAIDDLVAGLKVFADTKIEQLQLELDAAATAEEQAGAAVGQAKAAVGQAKGKEKAAWEYYQHALSSNEARHAAEEAKEAAKAAREAVNTAEKAASAAREQYSHLLQEKRFYYSTAFYFSYLRSPIQTAETDGDGKFAMEIPRTGAFVIAAQGERNVLDKTEQYHWVQPVSLEGQQQRTQNLSNNNLTRTTGTSSLILTED
jgi:hypothetical protein